MTDLEALDPELRDRARRYGNRPPSTSRARRAISQALIATLPIFPVAKTVTVTTIRAGRTRLRRYRPDREMSTAALLWIHGGGLVGGAPRQDAPQCSGTAAELGIQVFAARYRLAPQHPFPAAADDLLDAWNWLQRNSASLGIDPQNIAIGGSSAGGGLAAALAQRVLDSGDTQPAAQWLFAPMLDDRTAADHDLDAVDHAIWNNVSNRIGWSAYLQHEPGAAEVPAYAVPARREDLTGLPPAFVMWGSADLFADEDDQYARRLVDAGVPVTVDIVPGGAHGFEIWARTSALAVALMGRARAWLAHELGISSAQKTESET